MKFLHQEGGIRYGSIVLLATFGIYNIQRITKTKNTSNKSEQLDWINNNKLLLLILSGVALIGSLIIFSSIARLHSVILLSISALISFWYVFPIFKLPLRSVPFFKSVFVALTWTFTVIVLPMVGQYSTKEIFLQFFPFFLFFLGLAIPFDIRDLKHDSDQLQTIPQLFGVVGARIIAISAILIFYLIFAYFNVFMRFNLAFALTICGIVLLISKVEAHRNEPYLSLLDLSMAAIGVVLYMA